MKSFRHMVEAKMSRQHFQLIADVIASLELSTSIKKNMAEKFADAFENTNPMFKRDVFIKATRDAEGATDRIMKLIGEK